MSTRLAEAEQGSELSLPNFLIIGAMKAGSTSLARYLGAHPQVFMAPCKEVHFFDRNYDRGISWYAEHFLSAADDESAVGEATPNYLYLPEALSRMAGAVPQAKLVVILRNPVDRAYSHYWHEKARGRESLDFRRAIEAEPKRLKTADVEIRTHFSYLDQGRYLGQLKVLTRHFPRENLFIVLSEELAADPESAVRSVCRFIGVPEDVPDNVGRTYNAHISFRSLKVRKLAHVLASGGPLESFLARVVGRLNTRRGPYPSMDQKLRRTLTDYYEEDNRALASWLGRDLSSWME